MRGRESQKEWPVNRRAMSITILPMVVVCSNACFDPQRNQNLNCSEDGLCPNGLVCQADLVCSEPCIGESCSFGDAGANDDAVIDNDAAVSDAMLDAPLQTYALVPAGEPDVIIEDIGNGGNVFIANCPVDRVLTGFAGFHDISDGISGLQGICSLATANPDGTVVTTLREGTPLHGGTKGSLETIDCPENHIMTTALSFGEPSGQIQRLEIGCSPLSWDSGELTFEVGLSVSAGALGEEDPEGDTFFGTCGPGEVVAGFGGRARVRSVDWVSFNCFRLEAIPQ